MYQRITTAREHAGLNQSELGRRVGVKPQTVQFWERTEGASIPRPATLEKVASACNVSFVWLATGQGDISSNTEPVDIDNDRTPAALIPLISHVQAGAFCEAVNNFHLGDAEEWLPCPVNVGKNAYALRVKGDSMTSPTAGQRSYPEGTIIYVDPDKEANIGSRVIAKLTDTNEVTFKVYTEDSGKRFLKPINPQYPTLELVDGTHICGVVVGSFMAE